MEKKELIDTFRNLGFRQIRDTDRYEKSADNILFSCLFDDERVNIKIRIFNLIGNVYKDYNYFLDIYYVKYVLSAA